jgi:copper chaperone CopZ/cytochrome c biogenesis protein CcdA
MAKEKQGQEDLKDKAKDSKKNTGSKEKDNWKEYTYKVKGMHCPSCELAIERRLLREDGVEFVDASVSKGEVYVQYSKSKPSLSRLGHLFDSDDYTFCKMDDSSGTKTNDANNSNSEARVTCDNAVLFQKVDNKLLINKHLMRQYGYSFVGALLVILIFYILQRSGITSGFSVNEDSALGMFVLFGMVAGLSSCAALVGGLVLSMSKQWSQMYRDSTNFGGQYTPHILFNLGRLLSFGVFGAMLGGLGSIFSVSLQLSAVLAMLVSILMIVLSLQMLEVPFFKTIRLGLGKFISRWAMKKEKIDSPLGPFLLGAVTFFCLVVLR